MTTVGRKLLSVLVASRRHHLLDVEYDFSGLSFGTGRAFAARLLYMYNICTLILWNSEKARTNRQKHGVRFSDAEIVLFDPSAITVEDDTSEEERRFVTIGVDVVGRILVVIYCYRGDDIRLISARPADRKERQQYEEAIRF